MDDFEKLVDWCVDQLLQLKYAYDIVIEGCYDAAINNYGFSEPHEGRDYTIEYIKETLLLYID